MAQTGGRLDMSQAQTKQQWSDKLGKQLMRTGLEASGTDAARTPTRKGSTPTCQDFDTTGDKSLAPRHAWPDDCEMITSAAGGLPAVFCIFGELDKIWPRSTPHSI